MVNSSQYECEIWNMKKTLIWSRCPLRDNRRAAAIISSLDYAVCWMRSASLTITASGSVFTVWWHGKLTFVWRVWWSRGWLLVSGVNPRCGWQHWWCLWTLRWCSSAHGRLLNWVKFWQCAGAPPAIFINDISDLLSNWLTQLITDPLYCELRVPRKKKDNKREEDGVN